MNNRNEKGIDHSNVLMLLIQDDRYTTSYKQEFAEPDNRKKQFINTAESLLTKLQQQEHYINDKIKTDYSYTLNYVEKYLRVSNKCLLLIVFLQLGIWAISQCSDHLEKKVSHN